MQRLFTILVILLLPQLWSLTIARSGDAVGTEADPFARTDIAPVWRFWSPTYQRHFYTLDEAEKDKLLSVYASVWSYEGISYRTFPAPAAEGVAPVWRFWSPALGAHFYTLDERERDKLLADYRHAWTCEGVVFYAYRAGDQPEGTIAVHRYWSNTLRTHLYTTSDTERFKLASSYSDLWAYEGVAWYAYPAESPSLAAIVNGPYVREVTSDSATIVWETGASAGGVVRFGVAAPGEFVAFDPVMGVRHEVALCGLDPKMPYGYEVTSGKSVSPVGTFTTAPRPEQPFRFAVYGDTRTNPDTHRRVAAGIVESGPAIVFHTGDIVGRGRDYSAWRTEFFDPAGSLIMHAPVIPVPGNHEYSGLGPPWFFYYFGRPVNQGWFAMTYGNTRFIGLDTCAPYSPGSPQHDWLVRELNSPEYRSATWHVVIFHEPAFTCLFGRADNAAVQENLVRLFEQYGVHVAFQGHSHVYERYFHNGIHYIVTGGGGGPLYALAPDVVPPIREFGLAVHHHCVADVDPAAGTLAITAVDIDGQIFDRVELSAAQQK